MKKNEVLLYNRLTQYAHQLPAGGEKKNCSIVLGAIRNLLVGEYSMHGWDKAAGNNAQVGAKYFHAIRGVWSQVKRDVYPDRALLFLANSTEMKKFH